MRRERGPALPDLVVGAGAKGLTVALLLARQGRRVLVAEGGAAIGGLARSFRYGRFTFDFGLHAFVSAQPRVRSLTRELLGPDFREFTARVASRLPDGSLVEDSARWCAGGLPRSFHELFDDDQGGWNCMRVSAPPRVVYPRRGGFGRLLLRLQEELERLGGRVLLETRVAAADLTLEGGRVVSARLAGRLVRLRACHWTAGPEALAGRAPARSDALLLAHFMVKGRAPVPYHWVRVFNVATPFLPQLVYYPARFAPANAPRGCHGVGAVLPLSLAPGASPEEAGLRRRILKDPRALLPAVSAALDRAGLLREADVLDARHELLAVPADHRDAPRPGRGPRASNFFDVDRFYVHDVRESGVPLQMAAALRAAEAAGSLS